MLIPLAAEWGGAAAHGGGGAVGRSGWRGQYVVRPCARNCSRTRSVSSGEGGSVSPSW